MFLKLFEIAKVGRREIISTGRGWAMLVLGHVSNEWACGGS